MWRSTCNFLFFLIFMLLLPACDAPSEKQIYEKKLVISTNSWIGYVPLYYAKEKGYLDNLNIDLIVNVSLVEAADVYLVGNADIVTATQHEYRMLSRSIRDTVPFMLLDRSYGADVILSNRTLDQIKRAKKIVAYLEIDSVNADLLRDFIQRHHLDEKKFVFINKDQAQTQQLKPLANSTVVIVTYAPYYDKLVQKGFKIVGSTKEMKDLIVIDALFTHLPILNSESKRLKALKNTIDSAIAEINREPQKYYPMLRGYLVNLGYEDYLQPLKGIKWINHPSDTLLRRIEGLGYEKENIIK